MRFGAAVILLLLTFACQQTSQFEQVIAEHGQFNLAILNGTVVDGSGAAAYSADLLVNEGKIVFVGEVDADKIEATQVIDASGKLITPGFIDVHTHGDPLSGKSFENFLANGVTTIFLGQDGYHPSIQGQPYDLPAWMDSVEQSPLELNLAMLAGHGSIRRQAGIADQEQPTAEQLNRLAEVLNEALVAGSYGLSTGLEYVPGMYADKDELTLLAKALGKSQAIMASHMRNEDDDAVEASLTELLDLGAFCKVHASHLKAVYGKGADRGREILSAIEEARSRGVMASADVYPYTASYTGIGIVFPKWAKTQAQFEVALKTRKKELEDYLEKRIAKRNGPAATLFGSGLYTAKTLEKAAADEGISYVELLMKIGPQGASGAYFIMNQELQDVFINHPEVMIASDGSPTMLHPRGHGTQAKIIEQYVNEGTLSIEQAVYKMAGLPAQTFGLANRGFIKEGLSADLLIFDPQQVKEKATYANPYQFSEGFEQVIVNGVLARSEARLVSKSAGKLLRRGR